MFSGDGLLDIGAKACLLIQQKILRSETMIRATAILVMTGSFASQAAWAQGETPPAAAADAGWTAVLYALIVILIFAMAVFLWFQQRQKRKTADRNRHNRDV